MLSTCCFDYYANDQSLEVNQISIVVHLFKAKFETLPRNEGTISQQISELTIQISQKIKCPCCFV